GVGGAFFDALGQEPRIGFAGGDGLVQIRMGGLVKWFDGLAAFFRRLAEGRYRAAVCRARAGERVRREDEWLPCDCAVVRVIRYNFHTDSGKGLIDGSEKSSDDSPAKNSRSIRG